MRAGLGALRLLPAPSERTAPAPPAGCVPGAAWQRLRPQLAASVPGRPRLHLLSVPETRRAAGGGRAVAGARPDSAVLVWWAAARSRSALSAAAPVAVRVVVLCSWKGTGWVRAAASPPPERN